MPLKIIQDVKMEQWVQMSKQAASKQEMVNVSKLKYKL